MVRTALVALVLCALSACAKHQNDIVEASSAEAVQSVLGESAVQITASVRAIERNADDVIRERTDGRGADVIWAMQDRNTWSEDRRALVGNAGHTGYGHYRERYLKCDDGQWRIKSQVLSYLQMDIHPNPGR